MTATDNLIKIHTVDNAEIANSNGPAVIHIKDIGCISIRSGKIVLGDPMVKYSMSDFNRKCFSQTVPSGIYPVLAYFASTEKEQFVAFAEIRFSSKKPVKYVTAKTIVDTEAKRRGFCGYPVHNSLTGFMDADIYTQICNLPRFKDSHSMLEADEWQAGQDAVIVYDNEEKPCAVQVRVPSAYYYWYWGKDRNGEICCLIGDFFTFA